MLSKYTLIRGIDKAYDYKQGRITATAHILRNKKFDEIIVISVYRNIEGKYKAKKIIEFTCRPWELNAIKKCLTYFNLQI